MNYQEFLANKRMLAPSTGTEVAPEDIHPILFPFQRDLVRWALRKGRSAILASTGLGKTLMQCEVARQVNEPTLILAPLGVTQQTIAEAERLDMEIVYARDQSEATKFTISNYERLTKFDPSYFGTIILDESGILKSLDSKTREAVTKAFGNTKWRLCCSATPAPNDTAELGNHSQFLSVLNRTEMLATFFTHGDGADWRLKKHARDPFYRWLASWGMFVRKPSDLGYCVDEQTEILTAEGWKRHDALRVGEMVLALDKQTRISRWEPLKAVNVFPPHRREMLRMEGQSHDSLTTLGHRWAALLALLGPSRISLRSLAEPAWREAKHRNTAVFFLNNKAADLFEEVLDGRRIFRSSFVVNLTLAQLHLLIDTVVSGDGWRIRSGAVVSQKHREMLDSLQMVCALAGIRANVGYSRSAGQWTLTLMRRQGFRAGRLGTRGQRSVKERVAYDGLVWCPSTPSGTWLARRNGKVFFTHNSDEGFELPPLEIEPIIVPTDWAPEGQMFPTGLRGIQERIEVRRATAATRVASAVRLIESEPNEQWLVWCGLNDEADELTRQVPNAVNVQGSDSPESKAEHLLGFASGEVRTLVTKPKIAGFGMNWQRCARMVFVGLGDSFESYFQCIRRCWRFGQTRPVKVYIVLSEPEQAVYQNVLRKEREFNETAEQLVKNVAEYERAELVSIRHSDVFDGRQEVRLPSWL